MKEKITILITSYLTENMMLILKMTPIIDLLIVASYKRMTMTVNLMKMTMYQ